MSITPVPISIRLVRAAIAASSGNGADSDRAKWCTRTNAPSIPISSAAIASSIVWRTATPPVFVMPPPGCHAPNDRKPIFFWYVTSSPNVLDDASIPISVGRRDVNRGDPLASAGRQLFDHDLQPGRDRNADH